MKPTPDSLSNKRLAANGALLTTAAIFVYSLLVLLYVLIRSSFQIVQLMPPGERSGILFANAVSLTYAVAVFSVLMALLSSPAGAVAALVLKQLLFRFNPEFDRQKTIVFSGAIGVLLLLIVYVLLRFLLQSWMTVDYPETLLFWFGFPASICLAVCTTGGIVLNRYLKAHYSVVDLPVGK